jgi:LuxR family maltose regulon positive regulatory protein
MLQEQATTTVALAKIRPPQERAGLIHRDALEERLAHAVATYRVVLLCAPAGYGKTVALTRLLQRLPAPCARAWLTLDEDDDLQRFLACLSAALEPYDPPWRVAPEALATLQTPGEPRTGLRRIAEVILNALAATDVPRGLIVLDDAHRLTDARVFELLDVLVERLPAQWSLMIASRIEPPLALARLRVRSELAEFRQQDLCFSVAETEALAAQSGHPIDANALHRLLDRTQGWAAGLRLCLTAPAATSPGTSQTRTQRYLFDYLASEVLAQMPAPLRIFLLRCSVLHELTVARCAHVAGEPRARQLLEEIDRRGLFVTVLEAEELTLRLHDLFRDFLEDRLQREHADEVPALRARAAEGETDPVRKVGLLLLAGRGDEAEQTLARAASDMLVTGAPSQVRRLIEQFPAQARAHSPWLAFARGLAAWSRYAWPTLHEGMAQAAAGFDQRGQNELAQEARVFDAAALTCLGHLDAASALLARVRARPLGHELRALSQSIWFIESGLRGPAAAPAQALAELVDLLAQGAPPSLWHRCSMASPYVFIGRPGMRASMQRFATHARAISGDTHIPLRAAATSYDAWLALWQARLEDAQALIQEVQDDSRWLGEPRILRLGVFSFSAVHHALRGEARAMHEAARAMMAEIDADPQRNPAWRGAYLCSYARACACLDDWDTVRALLGELEATPTAREWPYMRVARLALPAQLALHEGQADAAVSSLAPALASSADIDLFGFDPPLRIVLAFAQVENGQLEAAARTLAPLLAQVRASDEVTGPLLAGPHPLRTLAQTAWGDRLPRADAALLVRLADLAASLRAPQPAAGSALSPPVTLPGAPGRLSERELAVLARISAGDSNKLIARAFDLSPHTVKRHVANILTKLDLASRGQAAAWYRENAD